MLSLYSYSSAFQLADRDVASVLYRRRSPPLDVVDTGLRTTFTFLSAARSDPEGSMLPTHDKQSDCPPTTRLFTAGGTACSSSWKGDQNKAKKDSTSRLVAYFEQEVEAITQPFRDEIDTLKKEVSRLEGENKVQKTGLKHIGG